MPLLLDIHSRTVREGNLSLFGQVSIVVRHTVYRLLFRLLLGYCLWTIRPIEVMHGCGLNYNDAM